MGVMTSTTALLTLCLASLFLFASHSQGQGAALTPASPLPRTNLLLYAKIDVGIDTVRSVVDWQKRRASILAAMQQVMGPLPRSEKRCPLDPQQLEEVDCGDYLRRKVTYGTEPGS